MVLATAQKPETMLEYTMPDDQVIFRLQWWSAKDAAKAWKISPDAARKYIRTHQVETRACTIRIRTPRGVSERLFVPAHTRRWCEKGNPKFRDRVFQAAMAVRRWNKAERCEEDGKVD